MSTSSPIKMSTLFASSDTEKAKKAKPEPPTPRSVRICLSDRNHQPARDNAAKTVLISAEAFCFLRTKEEWQNIREFAEMTNRRLEAIIVFRNNSDWRVSWENQLRYGLNLLDTSHDLPSELRLDGSWYFDKEAIRSFWSPIKLSELIYEDHPNIVEAIYQSFGVQTDNLKTDQRLNLRKSSPTATA